MPDDFLILVNKPIVTAIFGGMLSGLFTFLGIRQTVKNETRKMTNASRAEGIAFCRAIQSELQAIRDRYQHSLGNVLANFNPEQPFLFAYFAEEDYFTLYNSNAHMIGKIENDALRTQIVTTYTHAKGHLDTLRGNTLYVNQVNALNAKGETLTEGEKLARTALLEKLKGLTPYLIQSSNELLSRFDTTLAMMNHL